MVAFGSLLSLSHEDRAFCTARACLGGVIGALTVVEYAVWQDVFVGEGVTTLCFWAITGVVPGAGIAAWLGFVWDCLSWLQEVEEREEMEPLPGKEEV